MAGQQRHIAGHTPVHGLAVRLHGAVLAHGIAVIKQPAAQQLPFLLRFKPHGGYAAVAGNKGGDALEQEGLEIGQRIGLDGKPIVMGMGVDKAGRNGFSLQIDHPIGLRVYLLRRPNDPLARNQDIAHIGLRARAVIDLCVLQQRFHH